MALASQMAMAEDPVIFMAGFEGGCMPRFTGREEMAFHRLGQVVLSSEEYRVESLPCKTFVISFITVKFSADESLITN
jgi:hypothetical protein